MVLVRWLCASSHSSRSRSILTGVNKLGDGHWAWFHAFNVDSSGQSLCVCVHRCCRVMGVQTWFVQSSPLTSPKTPWTSCEGTSHLKRWPPSRCWATGGPNPGTGTPLWSEGTLHLGKHGRSCSVMLIIWPSGFLLQIRVAQGSVRSHLLPKVSQWLGASGRAL